MSLPISFHGVGGCSDKDEDNHRTFTILACTYLVYVVDKQHKRKSKA